MLFLCQRLTIDGTVYAHMICRTVQQIVILARSNECSSTVHACRRLRYMQSLPRCRQKIHHRPIVNEHEHMYAYYRHQVPYRYP